MIGSVEVCVKDDDKLRSELGRAAIYEDSVARTRTVLTKYVNMYAEQFIINRWRTNRPIHHQVFWAIREGTNPAILEITAIAGYKEAHHCINTGDFLYQNVQVPGDKMEIGVMDFEPVRLYEAGKMPPTTQLKGNVFVFKRVNIAFGTQHIPGYWERV